MYETDPNTSAIIFLLSVVFFTYFVMNMYTAIVVRTYNKLRESKFFLAEAMARILLKDSKDYLDKWARFFICRRTPKPTRKDREDDDQKLDKDAPTNKVQDLKQQSLASRIKYNWSQITQK